MKQAAVRPNPKKAGASPGPVAPATRPGPTPTAPRPTPRPAPGDPGTEAPTSVATLIQSIRAGLPFQELDALRHDLDLPMDRLAPMLGISKATLHRRKAAGRLDAAESDRVVRFARLLSRAAEVLESTEAGRSWLNSAQVGLGGAIPLEYAQTEVGAREVETLLGRIEHGVYS